MSMAAFFRKAVFFVHLWLGLVLGLYFALLGLTGAAMVFNLALDARLNPHLMRVEPQGQPKPVSQLVAVVHREYPGEWIRQLNAPQHGRNTWEFRLGKSGLASREVFVDPFRTRVVGERQRGQALMPWIKCLHSELLLDERGVILNGYGALLLSLLLASGVWLWWPREWKQLPSRLKIKRGAPFRCLVHNCHNAFGVYSLPLLLVITLSGAAFIFNEPVEAWVYRLTNTPPHPQAPKAPRSRRPDLSLDELLRRSALAAPNTELAKVLLPREATDALGVSRRYPEGVEGADTVQIDLDPRTGKVLGVDDPRGAAMGQRFLLILRPLHFGTWGGLFGLHMPVKALYVLLGFVPTGLFVTGALMWRERRRGRARTRARRMDVGHTTPELLADTPQRSRQSVPELVASSSDQG